MIIAAGVILSGCDHGASLQGVYDGHRDFGPGKDRLIANAFGYVKLSVKADRFDLEDGGIKMSGWVKTVDGGWDLEIEQILNRKPPKGRPEIHLHKQPNGKIRYDDPGGSFPSLDLEPTGKP